MKQKGNSIHKNCILANWKMSCAAVKFDSYKLHWPIAKQVLKIHSCGLENKRKYSEHVKLKRNSGNYTLDCFYGHVAG